MNALTNGSRLNLLPLSNLHREMNRWMDQWADEAGTPSACTAPVSIWETDTHYHLQFDLPGFRTEDIDVKIQENVLHVSASRPVPSDVKFLRQERPFGNIERHFALPSRVDQESIEATYQHGVLALAVAKAPEAQVKKIEIKS